MTRPKGSKNQSTLIKDSIKSEAKSKKKEKYKYKLGEIVFYIGNLFDNIKNIEGKIIRRSTSKSKIYYNVEFVIDGNIKKMELNESVLKPKF
jgi:hypothetical protein